MNTLKFIIISARPKQWVKNIIIIAPATFVLPEVLPRDKSLALDMIYMTLAAIGVFCMASAGVYLLNDIFDREKDRHHPEKKERPIASGRLSVGAAVVAMIVLFAGAFAGAYFTRITVLLIVALYVVMNLAYSALLKNLVIIDAFSIAFGFLFRILAGGAAIRAIKPDIEISTWIILCTLLGSLFIAFCKRRNELGLEDAAADHRASLSHYSIGFLDQMISISCSATVMAYALWTMWPGTVAKFGTQALFWTVPFVCYGIFRYLYLVHQKNQGGSPSKVFLGDLPLQINIFLWFIAVVVILYFDV